MSKMIDPAPGSRPRLCFVSYRHLSQLALPVVQAFRDRAEIEIIDEVFGPALELAKARERIGSVDAFVSAGANAMTLRDALKTPVATIRVDGYDILMALLKARTLSDRVGVVTFRQTIPELESVKALLSIEIAQRSYSSSVEAEVCFRALAAEGYKVIVGSSIVVELAERHGLAGILAYSESSVAQGIEAAIELARVARLETARTEQLNG
ncbi:MAG: PrpR N-terminal domain-containing protein, partial [Gammaproteobacteria bacterium]|nr:PrpR N-terminal domain-containing protein [Gammaproteobacteria bacterium]